MKSCGYGTGVTVADRPVLAPGATGSTTRAEGSGLDLTGERGDELRDRVVHTLGVIGWLTRGFVFLMIAGIVLKVAFTGGAEPQTASKSGVLSTLVDRTGGMVLVALLGFGAAAYVIARVAPVVLYRTTTSWQQRGQAAAAAIFYAPLVYSAFRLLSGEPLGSGVGGDEGENHEIGRWLLQSRGGTVVLLATGLGLLGYGGYQLYKGLSGKCLKKLDLRDIPIPEHVVRSVAIAGFSARAIIAALLGGYALWAAWRADGSSVHGVDGALRSVIAAPFGSLALVLVALGLAAFAAYCAVAAVSRPHEDG